MNNTNTYYNNINELKVTFFTEWQLSYVANYSMPVSFCVVVLEIARAGNS